MTDVERTEGQHLKGGEFQSDLFPETPRGYILLKISDKNAQPGLADFSRRHRATDSELSDDLDQALRLKGYDPELRIGIRDLEMSLAVRSEKLLELAKVIGGLIAHDGHSRLCDVCNSARTAVGLETPDTVEPLKRPTIDDLEEILNSNRNYAVEILPSGEIRAKPAPPTLNPLRMLKLACETCGHPFTMHAVDDEELRECMDRVCPCQQFVTPPTLIGTTIPTPEREHVFDGVVAFSTECIEGTVIVRDCLGCGALIVGDHHRWHRCRRCSVEGDPRPAPPACIFKGQVENCLVPGCPRHDPEGAA